LVAQLVEHKAENLGVAGSSPVQNTFMTFSARIPYKYLLDGMPFLFVENRSQRSKNINLLTNGNTILYIAAAKRLALSFYNSQLSDMLAYENPQVTSSREATTPASARQNAIDDENHAHERYTVASKLDTPILVYNFHSLLTQNRLFLFAANATALVRSVHTSVSNAIDSISELFMSANWLEREIAELHGIAFTAKKDLRNLMLQFGDLTAPFQKSFPSVGLKDFIFDPIKDTLVQVNLTAQG
jgi:NADH:ubiquinone oxidoreductase subunit C